MTSSELKGIIDRLCKSDKSGADSFITLTRWYEEQPGSDKHQVSRILVRWIIDQAPSWDIYLEVLRGTGDSAAVIEIANQPPTIGNDKWWDYVMVTLMRLGQCQFKARAMTRAREAAAGNRPTAGFMIGHLAHCAPNEAVQIAAEYLTRPAALPQESGKLVGIVDTFLLIDPHLIGHLVRVLRQGHAEAGIQLATVVSRYLEHPVVAPLIDKKVLDLVAKEVQSHA